VLSNVSYIKKLRGAVRETVLGSYVQSLEYSHGTQRFLLEMSGDANDMLGFSLACSSAAFLISFLMPDHSLL